MFVPEVGISGSFAICKVAVYIEEADHTIEPLKGVPVIRDLVVDKSAMQDRLSRISTRERASQITMEDLDKKFDTKVSEYMDATSRCARCLVCNAGCPVLSESPGQFIGPAGMVALSMRYYDPNDEADRVAEAVKEGLWNCILCGNCDAVCPALDIKHVEMWKDLRAAATARGLTKEAARILPFSG